MEIRDKTREAKELTLGQIASGEAFRSCLSGYIFIATGEHSSDVRVVLRVRDGTMCRLPKDQEVTPLNTVLEIKNYEG